MKLLRNRRNRCVLPSQANESAPPLHPTSELTSALVPSPASAQHTHDGIPVPSDERFARQFLRVWTRRLMLVCALLAVCTAAAVPLLSCLTIKQITLDGHAHYDAQLLIDSTGLSEGSELLSFSCDAVQSKLLQAYPYLEQVNVQRSLAGRVSITVTERAPRWALYIAQDSFALLDEQMRVLELTDHNGAASLCIIKFELFSKADENVDAEKGEIDGNEERVLEPGKIYKGNRLAITKLSALSAAWQTLGCQEQPTLIDISNPYAVMIQFLDGTTLALHECADAERQLRAALSALDAYRLQSGYDGPLWVDIDDFSRVSLHPIT